MGRGTGQPVCTAMIDNAQTHHPSIRPSPDYLRQLPTIEVRTHESDGEHIREYCQDSGFEFRIELKLETEICRYWLCMRCVGEGFADWREGAVIVEELDGECEMTAYGNENLKQLQRIDYCRTLKLELDRLLKEPESSETQKRLSEVRQELNELMHLPE